MMACKGKPAYLGTRSNGRYMKRHVVTIGLRYEYLRFLATSPARVLECEL